MYDLFLDPLAPRFFFGVSGSRGGLQRLVDSSWTTGERIDRRHRR
jgi:hypothetical protein